MSKTFRNPALNTMAFGGVPAGNMKAKEQDNVVYKYLLVYG